MRKSLARASSGCCDICLRTCPGPRSPASCPWTGTPPTSSLHISRAPPGSPHRLAAPPGSDGSQAELAHRPIPAAEADGRAAVTDRDLETNANRRICVLGHGGSTAIGAAQIGLSGVPVYCCAVGRMTGHERAPGSRGGAHPGRAQPGRPARLGSNDSPGGMWPFTCGPRWAQDGGVTASRDIGGTSIRKKVSGHDDGR